MTFCAGHEHHDAVFEGGGGEGCGFAGVGFGEDAADEQPLSAHALEDAGVAAELSEGGGECRALAAGVGAGVFAVDEVEAAQPTAQARGCRRGGAVAAGGEGGGEAVGGEHGDRKPLPRAFALVRMSGTMPVCW